MSKYCPICLGEFKASITKCPTDQCLLVSKKPEEFERLVDIYAAGDEIEAERIMSFLRSKRIIARESQGGVSQLPTPSDTKFIICVLKEAVEPAKAIIDRARKDGVISTTGNFL